MACAVGLAFGVVPALGLGLASVGPGDAEADGDGLGEVGATDGEEPAVTSARLPPGVDRIATAVTVTATIVISSRRTDSRRVSGWPNQLRDRGRMDATGASWPPPDATSESSLGRSAGVRCSPDSDSPPSGPAPLRMSPTGRRGSFRPDATLSPQSVCEPTCADEHVSRVAGERSLAVGPGAGEGFLARRRPPSPASDGTSVGLERWPKREAAGAQPWTAPSGVALPAPQGPKQAPAVLGLPNLHPPPGEGASRAPRAPGEGRGRPACPPNRPMEGRGDVSLRRRPPR